MPKAMDRPTFSRLQVLSASLKESGQKQGMLRFLQIAKDVDKVLKQDGPKPLQTRQDLAMPKLSIEEQEEIEAFKRSHNPKFPGFRGTQTGASPASPEKSGNSSPPDDASLFDGPAWDAVRHLPFKAAYYDCFQMYHDDTLYPIGCFATLEEAEAACRSFIDDELTGSGSLEHLLGFGNMPLILGSAATSRFSGLDYATQKAKKLFGDH